MSKVLLKQFIQNVISESPDHEQHRCFDGTMVPVESPECYIDVMSRIEDAAETRDSCPSRTDAREHYNGLLKVLRRKMRRAKKFIDLGDI
jgi:hypothetical protein